MTMDSTFKWSEAVEGGMVAVNLEAMMANVLTARVAHAKTPFPILLRAPDSSGAPMRPEKAGWTLSLEESLADVGLIGLITAVALQPVDVATLSIALSSSTDTQKSMPTEASQLEMRTMRELASPRVYGTWTQIEPFRPKMYVYGPHVFEGAPIYDGALDPVAPLCTRSLKHDYCIGFARQQVVLHSAKFTTAMIKPTEEDLPTGLPTTGYIRNSAEILAMARLMRSLARLFAWQWPATLLLAAKPLAEMAMADAITRGQDQLADKIGALFRAVEVIPLCPDARGLLAAFQGAKLTTLEGDGPLVPFPYREFAKTVGEKSGRTFRMLDLLPWAKQIASASVKDLTDESNGEVNIFSIGEALNRMPDAEIQRMVRMAGALGWTSPTDFGKYNLTFNQASYVITDGDYATEATPSLLLGNQYVLPRTSRHWAILPTHKLMDWGYTVLPVPTDEDPWEPWRTGFSNKVIPVWASMGEGGAEELGTAAVLEALAITGVTPLSDAYVPPWPNTPGYSEFPHTGDVPRADPSAAPGAKKLVGQEINPGDPDDLFYFTPSRIAPEQANILGRGDPNGRLLYRAGDAVFATRIVIRRTYRQGYVPMQRGGTWIGDMRRPFTRWEAGMGLTNPTADLGSALLRAIHIQQGA